MRSTSWQGRSPFNNHRHGHRLPGAGPMPQGPAPALNTWQARDGVGGGEHARRATADALASTLLGQHQLAASEAGLGAVTPTSNSFCFVPSVSLRHCPSIPSIYLLVCNPSPHRQGADEIGTHSGRELEMLKPSWRRSVQADC